MSSQAKMMGLGGIKGGMFLDGEKSPVRFQAGAPISFIVRVRAQDLHVDPNTIINLNRLGVGKGKRGIVLAKVGALGLGMGETKHPPLALRCHQYGSTSVQFETEQPLEPGEYMITSAVGPGAFLFGVDEKLK